MPTEQELEETYRQWPTEKLKLIIANKRDYTELATGVALQELEKRKVFGDEITELEKPKPIVIQPWMENCLYDLTFSQKLLFYFLSAPVLMVQFIIMRSRGYSVNVAYRSYWGAGFKLPRWMTYKSDGFLLKCWQVSYYKTTGLLGLFFGGAFSSRVSVSAKNAVFFAIWVGLLVVFFLFDIGYNKQRLTNKLIDYKGQGELPWGV